MSNTGTSKLYQRLIPANSEQGGESECKAEDLRNPVHGNK
jgi:hypothetical protein